MIVEGLSEGEGGEISIKFGDAIVGLSKTIEFRVQNTSKKQLKFNIVKPFAEKGEFKFKPQLGHIAPG